MSERPEITHVEPAEEAVDAVPVIGEVRALEPAPERSTALVVRTPAQAAVLAVSGFVAGAATLALLHRRRNRRALERSPRRGLRRSRGEVISVAGTRSFLVDVHLLNR